MGLARFLELVSSEWWITTGCLDQFCPPTHMGVLTSESEREAFPMKLWDL